MIETQSRLEHTNICSYALVMGDHAYEARCPCGMRWRIYLPQNEDDDPMATCINCGADTFDLTDIGALRSAGPGTT